jgi:hypothetical protein
MEKLAISKAIMDRHNTMGRSNSQSFPISNDSISSPQLESFESPEVRYNIPQELMSESKPINTSIPQVVTKDRILSSKLPDEIKKLMIENPIIPVNPMSPSNSVLSDELVEKASRLMGTKKSESIPQSRPQGQTQKQTTIDNSDMRKMMKEVVKEVLQENGLLLESSSKTNETVIIKVGQHIFEGRISKIKKTK